MSMRSLIAASFSEADAVSYESFRVSESEKSILARTGIDLLKAYPFLPGACVMMSALYSVMLEKHLEQRAFVVAGSLHIGEHRIFGEDKPIEGRTRFSSDSPSWDGHAWIILGDYLADAPLGRTARSGKGGRVLKDHIIHEFGPTPGLVIFRTSDAIKSGLLFTPQYVVTQNQVDALAGGAILQMNGAR